METARLLGKRIKFLRESNQMTQAELAEKTDRSLNFIALLERGKTTPSLQTIEKLAKALSCDMSALFEFSLPQRESVDPKEAAIRALLRRRTPSQIQTLLAIDRLVAKFAGR